MSYHWTVETKTVPVRPGALLFPDDPDWVEAGIEDSGERYRYKCTCGRHGPWRKNGNDADGNNHLYRAHGID